MTNLKSLIEKYDRANMLGTIKLIPQQAEDALRKIKNITLPDDYQNIDRILIIGMGGSILGLELIKNIFNFKIKKPLELISDYAPSIGNIDLNKTLFILSSYSGNTEEVLSWTEYLSKKTNINQANKQTILKILGITAGGQLEKWLKANKKPYYKINTKLNPCAQPRLAVAFSAFALLGFLKKLNLIENNINDSLIHNLITQNSNLTIKQFNNFTIISQIKKRIPIIISAEHLKANAHILANQLNENAKTFAAYFTIPELNHHLLPGLKLPAVNAKNLIFIFLESILYSPKNKLRIKLTKQILKQHKIRYINFNISQHNEGEIQKSRLRKCSLKQLLTQKTLNEALGTLSWGSYLSFYLAVYKHCDPSEISIIKNFKKKLTATPN